MRGACREMNEREQAVLTLDPASKHTQRTCRLGDKPGKIPPRQVVAPLLYF